jgi:hypothetical protein
MWALVKNTRGQDQLYVITLDAKGASELQLKKINHLPLTLGRNKSTVKQRVCLLFF